jgi:hypothetical protein
MAKSTTSRLATCPIHGKGLLTGASDALEMSNGNPLKLRAVLVLFATRHGSKGAIARALVAALREKGLKASLRSLYFWRRRYACFGPGGLKRRKRSDAGRLRRREPL